MFVLFKIGGSLLQLPELGERVAAVMAQRPDHLPLLLPGGGKAADLVREWDDAHQLGDEPAHWLAVRAMELNAAMLATVLPDAELVACREAAVAVTAAGRIPVLAPLRFLQTEEPKSTTPLPHNWDVTSDSIAAWIALHWPAAELVLVKSCPAPATVDETDAVDPWFPQLASKLPRMSWVNLRDEAPVIEAWSGSQ